MPWISRFDLESLRRAGNRSMQDSGRSDNTFGPNNTGMLLWRLNPAHNKRPGEAWENPFEYLHATDFGDEMVVFILCRSGPLILREPKAMFPSDALVAQCRLLLSGEK